MSGPRSNVLSANDISDGLSEEDEMSVTQTRRNLQLLPKRAADFYDRACGRQNGRACYNLGVLIMVGGLGVPDAPKTAALFRQGCELGFVNSCTNLGVVCRVTTMIKQLKRIATYFLFIALCCSGCDTPHTYVVLENNYPRSTAPLVVFRAFWQAASFQTPVPPGSSSDLQDTVPASANTAYAVLAPGWDVTSSTAPTSLIAVQSRNGFEVHLNHTLHIHVDDTTFVGNCASGSFLSPDQADFITQRVFASDFVGLRYDPASCTTAPIDAAGGR